MVRSPQLQNSHSQPKVPRYLITSMIPSHGQDTYPLNDDDDLVKLDLIQFTTIPTDKTPPLAKDDDLVNLDLIQFTT